MLTQRRIRDAEPGPETRILWDGRIAGFGLRIAKGGTKSYVLSFRTVEGRQRRTTLGRVTEITLKEARERAGKQLAAIRDGADPVEARQEAREAPTVDDGLRRFFGEYAPAREKLGRMKPSTLRDYGWMARRYIEPALGRRKIGSVTRRHVERMVAPLPGPQRNRVLALTSRLFNTFTDWGWRPENSNPCRGIEKAKVEARDRTLSPSELAALSKALSEHEKQNPAAVAAIRVAALTGLRISEVLGIRWRDVDFETGRLALPQTKVGARVHSLPDPALDVIRQLPRLSPRWVFSADGKAAITYKTLNVHFHRVCATAGIEGARPHDLRRTIATGMAAAGVGSHILRDALGWRTTQMADRYVRSMGSPVHAARQAIGAEIAAQMAGHLEADPT